MTKSKLNKIIEYIRDNIDGKYSDDWIKNIYEAKLDSEDTIWTYFKKSDNNDILVVELLSQESPSGNDVYTISTTVFNFYNNKLRYMVLKGVNDSNVYGSNKYKKTEEIFDNLFPVEIRDNLSLFMELKEIYNG